MLSESELAFFTKNGFIAKHEILNEKKCDQAVEIAWQELAKQNIKKQPDSWKSLPHLRQNMGVIKLRKEVRDNQFLTDFVMNNEPVHSIVRQLMGNNIECDGVRGVYPTFPVARTVARPYEPHIEMHPLQVFVMYYLDDVDTKNGGLYIWPGSHLPIYRQCDSKFDYKPKPGFKSVFDQFNLSKPIEITGKKGDVFFMHHRVLHSGSNNFQDNIRFGMLVDYLPQNFDELRKQIPGDDFWEDWSDSVQQAAKQSSQQTPLKPKYSLSRSALLKLVHLYRILRGQPAHSYEG